MLVQVFPMSLNIIDQVQYVAFRWFVHWGQILHAHFNAWMALTEFISSCFWLSLFICWKIFWFFLPPPHDWIPLIGMEPTEDMIFRVYLQYLVVLSDFSLSVWSNVSRTAIMSSSKVTIEWRVGFTGPITCCINIIEWTKCIILTIFRYYPKLLAISHQGFIIQSTSGMLSQRCNQWPQEGNQVGWCNPPFLFQRLLSTTFLTSCWYFVSLALSLGFKFTFLWGCLVHNQTDAEGGPCKFPIK